MNPFHRNSPLTKTTTQITIQSVLQVNTETSGLTELPGEGTTNRAMPLDMQALERQAGMVDMEKTTIVITSQGTENDGREPVWARRPVLVIVRGSPALTRLLSRRRWTVSSEVFAILTEDARISIDSGLPMHHSLAPGLDTNTTVKAASSASSHAIAPLYAVLEVICQC
jgi:hypothetical protein